MWKKLIELSSESYWLIILRCTSRITDRGYYSCNHYQFQITVISIRFCINNRFTSIISQHLDERKWFKMSKTFIWNFVRNLHSAIHFYSLPWNMFILNLYSRCFENIHTYIHTYVHRYTHTLQSISQIFSSFSVFLTTDQCNRCTTAFCLLFVNVLLHLLLFTLFKPEKFE